LASVRDRALPASYFRVDICSIASLNLSSKSIEPSRILSNIYLSVWYSYGLKYLEKAANCVENKNKIIIDYQTVYVN
jgi:hypothetical protein